MGTPSRGKRNSCVCVFFCCLRFSAASLLSFFFCCCCWQGSCQQKKNNADNKKMRGGRRCTHSTEQVSGAALCRLNAARVVHDVKTERTNLTTRNIPRQRTKIANPTLRCPPFGCAGSNHNPTEWNRINYPTGPNSVVNRNKIPI